MSEGRTFERSCGTCNVCCTHISIPVLGKPQGQVCQFDCDKPEGRCSIYDQRPQPCAQYSCSWLEGHIAEELRPDKVNMFFETMDLGTEEKITGPRVLMGFEQVDHAIDGIIDQLAPSAGKGIVIMAVHDDGEVSLIGDEDECMKVIQFFKQAMQQGGFDAKMADGRVRFEA